LLNEAIFCIYDTYIDGVLVGFPSLCLYLQCGIFGSLYVVLSYTWKCIFKT